MDGLTIEVVLQPEEAERLAEVAEDHDITPEDLLAAFVADLTYSDRSGDKEDHERAEHWWAGCKHRAW